MSLNPGQKEEYQQRHNPIWPELESTLKEHGVSNYSIFLDENTHQLFAYVEIESETRWNAIADAPVCKRWWNHMRDLMQTNADNSPVSKELTELFHID